MSDEGVPTAAKGSVLARTVLFEGLPPDDLRRLAKVARTLAYERGETIFLKGDPSSALYVIEAGRVRISTGSAEGRDVVLNLLGPGAVFGEIAMIDGGERTADAAAAEPVRLLALHRRDLMPVLEGQPRLMWRMLRAIAARLRWVSDRHDDVLFLDLPARAAKRLLLLNDQFGYETPRGRRLSVELPQRELASHMAVSRETVNRLLQGWLGEGLIEMDRDGLVLTDLAALKRLAGV